MNVLFVRRGSITVIDGISTYMLELASALRRLGHAVYVLCGNCSNIDKNFIRNYFIIDEVPPVIDWGKVSWVPGPKSRGLLKEVCREFYADVVHFQGFIPYIGRLNIHTVMTHHGFPMYMFPMYMMEDRMFRMGYKVLQYFTNYDVVIALSKRHRDEINQLLPRFREKVVVIPPGINVQKIRSIARVSENRENIIVHVGTRKEKNPEVSIKAFTVMYKTYGVRNFKLVVVGTPTNELIQLVNALPQDVKSKIIFTDVLSKTDLLRFIARSKVLIAPSIYEGFHILSLEASALGTPVVASNAIPEEAVANGVNGFRVGSPYDYESFAKVLIKVLKDEELWLELHRNALNRAEYFSSIKIAKNLIKIYESLI